MCAVCACAVADYLCICTTAMHTCVCVCLICLHVDICVNVHTNIFVCTQHLCVGEAVQKIHLTCLRVCGGGQAIKGGASRPASSNKESKDRDRGGWRRGRSRVPCVSLPWLDCAEIEFSQQKQTVGDRQDHLLPSHLRCFFHPSQSLSISSLPPFLFPSLPLPAPFCFSATVLSFPTFFSCTVTTPKRSDVTIQLHHRWWCSFRLCE